MFGDEVSLVRKKKTFICFVLSTLFESDKLITVTPDGSSHYEAVII
jgi:hypothetical protein